MPWTRFPRWLGASASLTLALIGASTGAEQPRRTTAAVSDGPVHHAPGPRACAAARFCPDDNHLYAAGGRNDVVYDYVKGKAWSLGQTIALGHNDTSLGIEVSPNASCLAISADGKTRE